jgi:glucose/galactose transporter
MEGIARNSISVAKIGTQTKALFVIGVLFFVFGFVSWANSMLIPYFKIVCNLTDQQAMLVAFAFYISYFVMAMPASFILQKTGLKNGMSVGLFIMAIGATIFIPAAMGRTYFLFLIGLFVMAAGLTVLQTASNPYVVFLGSKERAAQRISIMGICNKVAGAIAPILLIKLITKSDDEIDNLQKQLPLLPFDRQELILDELAGRLVIPYLAIILVLSILGVMIRFSDLPNIEESEGTEGGYDTTQKTSLFQYPHLFFGVIAIFCAVGVEVLAVDSIINYGKAMGLSFKDAKFFATYTLIIMIFGYIFGSLAIPTILSQKRALQVTTLLGLVLTIGTLVLSGIGSVWCVALLGLANALLWPAIWPLALDGLGKFAKQGSALLVMGVTGGALVPLLYGALSDNSSPQMAYGVMIPCYMFMFFFAVIGHKIKN